MKHGYQEQTVLERGEVVHSTGKGRGWVGVGSNPGWFFFFFFFFFTEQGLYVLVCVSVLFPRIEPVGRPYMEVCLQTLLWPWKIHPPSSWWLYLSELALKLKEKRFFLLFFCFLFFNGFLGGIDYTSNKWTQKKENKRPKGPHIVHLSRMCHLFEESAKADIFVYWSARKTQTQKRMLRSCFLSSFVEFGSAVSKEKSKMSRPIRGQGGYLVFQIGPKNTNLVEDVEILLPVKFHWIPFSGFKGEVENVSANQRPGRLSCFSDRPQKRKLGRGRWDLASCQVSLNSIQRFQRRSRKCLSQSKARAALLFFRSARKTQTWLRTLRSCFLWSFVEFHSAVSEEKSKMSQPIRGQAAILFFRSAKKTQTW